MSIKIKRDSVTASLKKSDVDLPFWVLEADRDGPTFLISASLHGNEVQGAEVIRRLRLIAEKDLLCGRLFLVPFANVPAVLNRRPHIVSGPETPYGVSEGDNINLTWPGDPEGTDAARVTHALFPAVVEPADVAVDFHCWPGMRATTALYRKGHAGARALARASCVRFAKAKGGDNVSDHDRYLAGKTLTGWFVNHGHAALCIELSGQYTMVEREVRRGLRAILNILKLYKMMPGGQKGLDEKMVWLPEADVTTLKAEHEGLFAGTGLKTSDHVEQGQLLGHLMSTENLEETEIRAPMTGYLWSYGRYCNGVDVSLAAMHPVAEQGNTLVEIARPCPPPD